MFDDDVYIIEINLAEDEIQKKVHRLYNSLNEREQKVFREAFKAVYFSYEPDMLEHLWEIVETFVSADELDWEDPDHKVMSIWYDELDKIADE